MYLDLWPLSELPPTSPFLGFGIVQGLLEAPTRKTTRNYDDNACETDMIQKKYASAMISINLLPTDWIMIILIHFNWQSALLASAENFGRCCWRVWKFPLTLTWLAGFKNLWVDGPAGAGILHSLQIGQHRQMMVTKIKLPYILP